MQDGRKRVEDLVLSIFGIHDPLHSQPAFGCAGHANLFPTERGGLVEQAEHFDFELGGRSRRRGDREIWRRGLNLRFTPSPRHPTAFQYLPLPPTPFVLTPPT